MVLLGTSYVLEDADFSHDEHHRPGLKCDRSGPVPIILVPQPSDDPYDPLVCINDLYFMLEAIL
jgi:hypothetical protein